jgi:CDP-glucose 4,6-dehydratase
MSTTVARMEWQPDKAFWRHRNVAVTGGTGFLGSHVVSTLSDLDAEVVVLVRDDEPVGPVHEHWWSKVRRISGDVRDQALMERVLGECRVATLLHLAAQTQVGVASDNPVSTFESNVRGTWSVLEAVRRSPRVGQTVVASTDKAYGAQEVLPYHEKMPLLAVHPYDVSKAAAEMIAASYAHTFGLNLAITRCGNFFGPGDNNWERLFPGTIRQLLSGQRPVIRSDGSPTRDYLFVKDGARSYLQLAEALADRPGISGEAFNFSAERPMTVLEAGDLMQSAVGTDLEPDIRATATAEIPHQYLSAEKARQVLGWQPQHTFEESLELTVAWYRATLGG